MVRRTHLARPCTGPVSADESGVAHTYTTKVVSAPATFEPLRSITQSTVFTPPGLVVDAAKYPVVMAGVLASTAPLEHIAIFDHPETWLGLDRESILSMRRSLYHFAVPIDTREMGPSDLVETLQTVALSIAPVAIGVEASSLPPRQLQPRSGMLPTGPTVRATSLQILSEPETSMIAERVISRDLPAADAVWRLLDYDYSLDQVARLFAVGLLGKHSGRRMVPTRGAYKAIIDTYVSRVLMEISEKTTIESSRIYASTMLGEHFIVLVTPGPARVDYLRIESGRSGGHGSYSLENVKTPASDAKASLYSDHSRFASYSALMKERRPAHVTVFHNARDNANSVLGAWIARAGVARAMNSGPLATGDVSELLQVLDSVLHPGLDVWWDMIPSDIRPVSEEAAGSLPAMVR